MDEIIDVGGQHKCAYELCRCQVSTLNTYCSEYCSYADDIEEEEVACDCHHPPCEIADIESQPAALDQRTIA